MIGQTISHYKILDKLGEGGMGVVYKAHDTNLDRTVALKFLPQDSSASDESNQRFLQEARAVAQLNHPNICSIYHIDEHDKKPFLVLEYVDGTTLRQRQKTGYADLKTVETYAVQIAEALAEAHSMGIVHRDIKPENIMINSKGRIKVMDFGLAKLKGSMNLTKTGSTVGTARYMSPEQIEGSEIDQRSDIWSFGVVLYEMITGFPPFRGEYETALMYQILNEDPPNVSGYRDDIPEKFERCLAKSLEKSVDNRYDSMETVIRDLREMTGGNLSEGIPVVKPERSGTDGLSVAVVDFQNITGHGDDEWLAGGIAETVTVDLTKISSLRVVSREKVLKTLAQYSDEKLGDRQVIDIGQNLKVRWMVWGAYQKMGNKIRITAHFTDVPTGDLIHSTKVDGAMDDIFELQDTIILNLKDTLNLEVKTDELETIKQPQTNKVFAFEQYAKGRQLFYKFDQKSLTDARAYFQKAIDGDPNYALAYSGLGTTYIFHYIAKTDTADLDKGIESLNKALELDNTLAESHHWLSYAYGRKHNSENAIFHGKRAVALDPHNHYAYYFLAANYLYNAVVLYDFKMLPKAARAFKQSMEIEPAYQWNYMFLGWFHMMYGNYSKALDIFHDARTLDQNQSYQGPRCIGFYPLIGFAYCYQGNIDKGFGAFEESLQMLTVLEHVYKIPMIALTHCGMGYANALNGRDSDAIKHCSKAIDLITEHPESLGIGYHMVRAQACLSKIFYRIGMKKEAEESFNNALYLFNNKEHYNFNLSWFDTDASLAFELAGYYALLRETQKTIDLLNRAVRYGWRDYTLLENDDSFRHVTKNKEFREIVDTLKSEPVIPELS